MQISTRDNRIFYPDQGLKLQWGWPLPGKDLIASQTLRCYTRPDYSLNQIRSPLVSQNISDNALKRASTTLSDCKSSLEDKYDSLRRKIRGPVFSVVTPFREKDDSIDFDCLDKYLERAWLAGAGIFYVMAYNSRYSQLSEAEIKELNRHVTTTVKGLRSDNIVIVANPLHCPTRTTVEHACHATDIGADVFSVICRERYYCDDQIFNHYRAVNDHSDIAILIHEMPFLNGLGGPPVGWPMSLLERVAKLPHVIAVKEDAKDDEYSRKVITRLKDRLAIIISGGGKRQWLRFANDGCQAWLNGIGVFEPRLAVRFWEAYQQDDLKTCSAIIEKIEIPFFEKGVQKFGWHLAAKAALQYRGHMSRHERLPMQALSEEQYQQMVDLLKSLPVDQILEGAL